MQITKTQHMFFNEGSNYAVIRRIHVYEIVNFNYGAHQYPLQLSFLCGEILEPPSILWSMTVLSIVRWAWNPYHQLTVIPFKGRDTQKKSFCFEDGKQNLKKTFDFIFPPYFYIKEPKKSLNIMVSCSSKISKGLMDNLVTVMVMQNLDPKSRLQDRI